jgi:hypothetical protein
VDILSSLADLSDERLAEYEAEVRAAFDALVALDAPTAEQVAEAEGYADAIDAIAAESGSRAQAAEDLAARAAALRNRFAPEASDDEGDEPPAEEGEGDAAPEGQPDVQTEDAAPPVAAKGAVATLARRTTRPPVTRPRRAPIAITAAADVPEFATGSVIEDLGTVSTAMINRMRGFGTPSGDGTSENLQHYGVASFRLDFPKELTIDRHSDDMEVINYAMTESRLPGASLVAAGGWCAPSETIYDLCAGETTEGILSVPEVNVSRGGIKYTSGPDFSAIYSNVGFCQTEAQAIAGTAKPCFEVPCPPFTEVRLDACGLCIKAPILTQAAYPELVARWISGAMIAHQHKMNAKVISAIVTAAGASKTITALGTTAGDTLSSLELLADGIRSKYRLSFTHTMEVVLPFWAKGAIRSDLSLRTGQDPNAVTDEQINAHFAARHLAVSFVYDWQDTPFPAGTAPAIAYPANVQALIYPAGTFIKGTADVINLNAVYDAASLATNVYTALFFEQGILVAKTCYEAALVTVPVCNAGESGAADIACA